VQARKAKRPPQIENSEYEFLSRFCLRIAFIEKESRVYGAGDPDPGARYWRKYSHLQRVGRRRIGTAAVSRPRSARDHGSLQSDFPDEAVPVFRQDVTLAVRTLGDVTTIIPAIKKAVYEASSDQPVYNVQTMQQLVSRSMGRQRFPTVLLAAFAGLALLLACVGTYGVISYWTSQRMHEIGIRMAVCANQWDVFGMIIGQGIRLALVGVAIGIPAALILAKALPAFSRLLYGVGASDPATLVGTSLVLVSTGILACYVPARRAARLDPTSALRGD